MSRQLFASASPKSVLDPAENPQHAATDLRHRGPPGGYAVGSFMARAAPKHILDCYGRQCFSCGTGLTACTLSMDHIIPRSKGGDDRPTNLQAMCGTCNNAHKKDAPPETAHIFLDFLTRPTPARAQERKSGFAQQRTHIRSLIGSESEPRCW
jgi:5-methylcytosine-specific restriction endonuclease McrA